MELNKILSITGVKMHRHTDNHRWFTNTKCEYYPCHDFKEINCLFCFCPLYFEDDCNGEYIILKSGTKDCSKCFIPHSDEGYDRIVEKLKKIVRDRLNEQNEPYEQNKMNEQNELNEQKKLNKQNRMNQQNKLNQQDKPDNLR